jgi:hypothetical protein
VEATRELWQRTDAELDRLEALAGDAFQRVGGLRLAADDEERAEIGSPTGSSSGTAGSSSAASAISRSSPR